jgi:uncharacterized protein (TIGR02391 family)
MEMDREILKGNIIDDELRDDCSKLLKNNETYIDAIRRANVVLETRLLSVIGSTGNEKSLHGTNLVRYALAPNTGKLILSDEPNEQDGVFQLFSGAFAFIRNPPAHKKVQYSEIEAWRIISFIDYLLLLLKQVRQRK